MTSDNGCVKLYWEYILSVAFVIAEQYALVMTLWMLRRVRNCRRHCYYMRWLYSNHHHSGSDYDKRCNDNRTNYNAA